MSFSPSIASNSSFALWLSRPSARRLARARPRAHLCRKEVLRSARELEQRMRVQELGHSHVVRGTDLIDRLCDQKLFGRRKRREESGFVERGGRHSRMTEAVRRVRRARGGL